MMSPVVVLSPPVMDLAIFLWVERSLLVIATEPLVLPDDPGLCRYVYQTSALYENLGTATVLYSCLVSDVDSLLADFVTLQSLAAQNAAVERALACCRDQRSFGSNITPKYLYDVTGSMVVDETEPSSFGLSRVSPPGKGSL